MARRKLTVSHGVVEVQGMEFWCGDDTDSPRINTLISVENQKVCSLLKEVIHHIHSAVTSSAPTTSHTVFAIHDLMSRVAAEAHTMGQAFNHNVQREKASFEFSGTPDPVLEQERKIFDAVEQLREVHGKDGACLKVSKMREKGLPVWRSTRKNKHGAYAALSFEGVKGAYRRHKARTGVATNRKRLSDAERAALTASLVDDKFVPLNVFPGGASHTLRHINTRPQLKVTRGPVKKKPK